MAIVCNCPAKCEIHPQYDAPKPTPLPVPTPIRAVPAGSAPEAVQNPPTAAQSQMLDPADKLQLKVLEAESLKAQIEMERARQQLMQRAQLAHQQLEQFCAVMFDKHGLKQGEWSLDLSKLEFVRR